MKTLLAVFFVAAFSLSAGATIAIEAVVGNSIASQCEGSFTVVADGTAGPFTVVIVSPLNGVPEAVYNNIKLNLTLEDLCNGVYEVRVFPTRFPNCVTILEADLQGPKDLKALTLTEVLKLEISPNPTRGKVMLSLTVPQVDGVDEKGDWAVTVLDANGLVLKESALAGSAKSNHLSLPLDLSNYPRGVYYVRVRSSTGAEETGRVVVQ